MIIDIAILSASETMFFAASELARYLRLISLTPVTCRVHQADKPVAGGYTLAVAGAKALGRRAGSLRASADDDAVQVEVKNGSGLIVGANERSVFLGVYRLLHHLGCRWVRPGPEGEYLPRIDLAHATAKFTERASLRHRVICIEGAESVENVLAVVDWAPKAGFSGYFMQFPDGRAFFARWYRHHGDAARQAEPFSPDAARAFTIHIEQEIRKRSLVYHGVGHGWTCKALGIDGSDWEPFYAPLAPQVQDMLAQVGGQRAYQWDRPMITSLCFSQPQVQKRMVRAIVDHAVQHPEVDLLHVWLDDGGKNKCECPRCSQSLPSDLYVQMLHALDQALTAAGSKVRIVFIGYSDLLWAPRPPGSPRTGTKPLNPKRFVFVYANSRVSYAQSLRAAVDGKPSVPPYLRNKFALKRTPEEFTGFLKGWQQFFKGDSLLFEYHFGGGRDVFDSYALARVLHEDVRCLAPLGLNGLASCQAQRAFFPTGLPMYVLGQTLWQSEARLDTLMDEYFFAAFGPGSALCKEFIKVSGETLGNVVKFTDRMVLAPDAPTNLVKLEGLIGEFAKVVQSHATVPDPCRARSWYYMTWHLDLLTRLAGLLRLMATANNAAVLARWQELRAFLTVNEDRYQAVLDVWALVTILDRYLVSGRYSSAPEAVVQ